MSCPEYEIAEGSGFAHHSLTPRLWGGWSQSGKVQVAGLQVGESKGKLSVQLFVVEECSSSWECALHPLQVASSKSSCCCYCRNWVLYFLIHALFLCWWLKELSWYENLSYDLVQQKCRSLYGIPVSVHGYGSHIIHFWSIFVSSIHWLHDVSNNAWSYCICFWYFYIEYVLYL